MRSDTAADVSLDHLEQYEKDWTALCAKRRNVLLEGSAAATNAALLLLQAHLHQPVAWSQPHTPLRLPRRDAGAFVLRDVAALSASDQARLLEWSERSRSSTQIVSTTEGPLYAQVVRGLFDATLYYRLNIMLLRVGAVAPAVSFDVLAEQSRRRIVHALTDARAVRRQIVVESSFRV
jgi:hypothetical protein